MLCSGSGEFRFSGFAFLGGGLWGDGIGGVAGGGHFGGVGESYEVRAVRCFVVLRLQMSKLYMVYPSKFSSLNNPFVLGITVFFLYKKIVLN